MLGDALRGLDLLSVALAVVEGEADDPETLFDRHREGRGRVHPSGQEDDGGLRHGSPGWKPALKALRTASVRGRAPWSPVRIDRPGAPHVGSRPCPSAAPPAAQSHALPDPAGKPPNRTFGSTKVPGTRPHAAAR